MSTRIARTPTVHAPAASTAASPSGRRRLSALGLFLALPAAGVANADVYFNYTSTTTRQGTISAFSAAGEPLEAGYAAPPFTYDPILYDECVQVGGSKACLASQSSWPVLPGNDVVSFVASGSLLATKGPGGGFAISNDVLSVAMLVGGLGEGERATFKFAGLIAEDGGDVFVSISGPDVSIAYSSPSLWNDTLQLGNGVYTVAVQASAVLGGGVSGQRTAGYSVVFELLSHVQCGGEEEGSCFLVHGPGCNSADCCGVVCEFDPWCCDVGWDVVCVDEAIGMCAPTPVTEGLINPRNGHRYTLISPAPWPVAQLTAAMDGVSLVTVDDGLENAWLLDNLLNHVDGSARSAWIGLADPEGDGVYQWASGLPAGYLNFAPGEPVDHPSDSYVLMDETTGLWTTVGDSQFAAWSVAEHVEPQCPGADDCFQAFPGHSLGCNVESCCHVVCERDGFCCLVQWDLLCVEEAQAFCAPQVVAGPIPNPTTGSSYVLIGLAAWSEAERWALEHGGHLTTIDNEAENAWIWLNLQSYGGVDRKPFIGLHDQISEGYFRWVDHAPATFFNWAPGEPLGFPEEDYVFMNASGTWEMDYLGDRTVPHHAVIELPCTGDLDGSGAVDGADLGVLLGAWASSGAPADINGDGLVDGSDLGLLLGAWGSCGASTCCDASGGAGCDQPGCAACVCQVLPHCCETAWDDLCVSHADSGCSAACACGG